NHKKLALSCVTLSAARGLAVRSFATLGTTGLDGYRGKRTNVLGSDLDNWRFYSLSLHPYSSSLRYRVLRSIPKISATSFLFPSVNCIPNRIYSRSISASVRRLTNAAWRLVRCGLL